MGNTWLDPESKREILRRSKISGLSQAAIIRMLLRNSADDSLIRTIIIEHMQPLRDYLHSKYANFMEIFKALIFSYDKLDSDERETVNKRLNELHSDMSKGRLIQKTNSDQELDE